jgi:DNA transformation protein and related proteins
MARKKPANDFLNIGPKSMAWLQEIGIHTRADLEQLGSVMAYRILRDRFPNVSLNMLYALEGALTGRKWNEFTSDEKARLRREAEDTVRVRVNRGS